MSCSAASEQFFPRFTYRCWRICRAPQENTRCPPLKWFVTSPFLMPHFMFSTPPTTTTFSNKSYCYIQALLWLQLIVSNRINQFIGSRSSKRVLPTYLPTHLRFNCWLQSCCLPSSSFQFVRIICFEATTCPSVSSHFRFSSYVVFIFVVCCPSSSSGGSVDGAQLLRAL